MQGLWHLVYSRQFRTGWNGFKDLNAPDFHRYFRLREPLKHPHASGVASPIPPPHH